ncbi:fibronectin type III domain-containing protein [Microbacterium fluvii]|uniref:Fibronectin type III domain-containing protein n=1 Tax=Microbacterium fluvii TaxID=415215 RepID=A0ABW2H8V4_9MICO|nr:fibronectin type III domain-containing protein [Microbacterium fluvii]MCU4671417.1 fibronectin type III domain-containing protein [Microbacterium fluvii]
MAAAAVATIGLMVAGLSAPAQAEAPFVLSGRIVDATDAPVVGATVSAPRACQCGDIADIPAASATTDADGRFSVTVRDVDTAQLQVAGPAPFVRSILTVDGELAPGGGGDMESWRSFTAGAALGDLELQRGVRLSGVVNVTGFPAAGSGFISISGGASGYYSATYALADGTRTWETYVPQGSYAVTAYGASRNAAYAGGGQVAVGSAGAAAGTVAIAGTGYAVRGTAVDPDGRAAAGVIVDLYPVDGGINRGGVLTDAAGVYTVVDVPAATYRISLQNSVDEDPNTGYGYWPGLVDYDDAGQFTVGGAAGVKTVAGSVTIERNAPSEPRSVTATASDAAATVSWTTPAKTGAIYGRLYKYTVTAAPGGQTVVVDGTEHTAQFSGLTNGTAYSFTVVASNGFGDSPASASSNTVTPGAAATAPGAPTGVTANPGNAQAVVSFTAPTADGGSPITGYTVTASPGGAKATVAASARSATVSGLANGTTYTFTVTAANAIGSSPASAPSAAVTPITTPSAPRSPAATSGSKTATVTWTAPSSTGGSTISGYEVTASPGGKKVTVSGTARSASVTGLTNGTAYTFTVKAKNAAGPSAASAKTSAVTPSTVTSAPRSVKATAGTKKATVSWTAPSSTGGATVTNYKVTASPGGKSVTVSGSARKATVTGLKSGTKYTFTVKAKNVRGWSAASAKSTAVKVR